MENKGEKGNERADREEGSAGKTGGLGVLAPRSFPMNLNKNEMERKVEREAMGAGEEITERGRRREMSYSRGGRASRRLGRVSLLAWENLYL